LLTGFITFSPFRRHRHPAAFTLLEVLAAVIVLAILVALIFPNYSHYFRRAQEARCAANLRALNIGLRGYLHDHQSVWPQGPSLIEEKAWETFWLATLEPYGITPRDWQCPTVRSAFSRSDIPPDRHPKIHYIPTMFTAEPDIANRWSNQPWLIERSDAHGQGPLICFPDGSVKSAQRVLAELGAR
jgi:prepilin-type N-terminal cleavage/methylation domain-containing protein